MRIVGGLCGGLAAALVLWNKEIFGNQSLSILKAIASGLVLIFIAAIIQYRSIKLKVAETQSDETSTEENK